jgi:hypothetical protein
MLLSQPWGTFIAATAAMLVACLGASAQTAPELQTYRAEVTVPFSNIGAFPAPNVPVADAQAIQGGALEIRQSIVFTASTRRLSVRTFLVAPGSPNPTPAAGQTLLHESYEVNVDSIAWAPLSVTPPGTVNSVVITGRVAGNSLSIAGDIANRLFVHSVGFDPANRNNATSTANNLTNITTTVAGRYTLYAQQGRGTVGFASDMTSPGPGTPTFTVTPTAGQNATTALSEIQLSSTVENASGTVTYNWRTVGKSAAVIAPTTATPRVQFAEGFGEYIFEVTARDASGNTAIGQVKVLYVGRF